MTPLKIALIVKNKPGPRERENRNMGWFSYPVPEFTWEHFSLGDPFDMPRSRFKDFDVIFMEDGGGNYGLWRGTTPPVILLAVDSTLSEPHYMTRFDQARRSDLVLVDHDRLERFSNAGPPVRRWNYCVNDRIFKPLQKNHDIDYHCGTRTSTGNPGGSERAALRVQLHEICKAGGWTYSSGALGLPDYSASMGSARIVVNLPRTPINRPHRVFDALACGACLVTGDIPIVDGDNLLPGKHYHTFNSAAELPGLFSELLTDNHWTQAAIDGNAVVMAEHTWSVRAAQLRQIIREEFGL